MNPKTSKPDRKKKGDRRKKEPSDFEETTLSIDRVTRVVAGGRRMRFRAVVVIGDKKGRVGLGTGKANEVQAAVQKATAVAKRNMIKVPVDDGSIPHEIDHKFKAARIRLIPAREGTGIIAGGALRVVLEHAGIRNVLSKRYGTTNKLVNAQCTMKALMRIAGAKVSDAEDSKRKASQSVGGRSNKDLGLQDTPELEKVEIKEVSKADVGRDGGLEKKK
ncbi:MAG: 30S ribosomal protein S5 [Candidatus Peribacter sp.]|jgi:small subunit ribosomal protein S5|nr:30S ribosomal protein S5 [Candidatus Peribacter sp.]MBT4392514.1 30S ribosomal protein S5 [Candidatus Peribacter sp.]MBT4601405.1 30S ribosomal protein S5 [Candidatus Peribacter sp.]MBT5149543.1 30S ribosomal protein S5 [Candidatus Peribacter sp.]MBT5638095.1 30S ribosomal protein S5 [Candidatus Peribacter sp.]